MKRIFPAFAAAATTFAIGSSLSSLMGHPEWIARGLPVCVIVGWFAYRPLLPKSPRRWSDRSR